MQTCKELVASAGDHLIGSASLSQKWHFYLHIFICKHCRRYAQQLKLTLNMVKQSGSSPSCSAEDIDDIVTRLKNSKI